MQDRQKLKRSSRTPRSTRRPRLLLRAREMGGRAQAQGPTSSALARLALGPIARAPGSPVSAARGRGGLRPARWVLSLRRLKFCRIPGWTWPRARAHRERPGAVPCEARTC